MSRPKKIKRGVGRPPTERLTPQQEILVAKYFECNGNKRAAALAAGYNPRSSPNALFNVPLVKATVLKRQAELRDKYELSEEWVVQRLMRIADGNLSEILIKLQESENDLKSLTNHERYFLDEFTDETTNKGETSTRKFKVKGADRLKALDMLSRKLGLYKDTITHEVGDSIAERLQRGRMRAAQIEIIGEPVPIEDKHEPD